MTIPGIDMVAGGESDLDRHWSSDGAYWSAQNCLYQVLAGSGVMAVDGRRCELRSDMIYLIPGHHRHQRWTDGMRLRWVHLRCRPHQLDLRFVGATSITAWPSRQRPELEQALACLSSLRSGGLDDPCLLRLTGVFAQVVGEVLEGLPAVPALPPPLTLALAAIEQDFRSRPSLTRLAASCGVSAAHLQRLFRTRLGLTPARCLEDRRMDEALRLLAGGSLPIAEVATACGYDDPFHFARVVRRRYGVSPRRLR